MEKGYFKEVRERYGTEVWTNNASGSEMKAALEAGAVGGTTNPCSMAVLLKSDTRFAHVIIDEAIKEAGTDDDEEIAMLVLQKAVLRLLKLFHPLYRESNGRYGYAAIQGNPGKINDLETILKEAEKFHNLGENIIIKVPSTIVGAQAMEELIGRGWATIGTACFTVTQYILMAEAYRRGLRRTNKKPKCLIAIIPSAMDKYFTEYAAKHNIKVSPDVICQAGIIVKKAAYKICRERDYEAILISGGGRETYHWTELTGPDAAHTLSAGLAGKLLRERPQVTNSIHEPAPLEVIESLRQNFPDFTTAHDVGGQSHDEILSYEPLIRFNNFFNDGFDVLINEIRSRKK